MTRHRGPEDEGILETGQELGRQPGVVDERDQDRRVGGCRCPSDLVGDRREEDRGRALSVEEVADGSLDRRLGEGAIRCDQGGAAESGAGGTHEPATREAGERRTGSERHRGVSE
ncbi:hypothetical protein [Nannocystis pusilla]|uniref:hypothetical protein n=1 Tax=Nannocystis pusilla TaxID=889268 RepID=UPI003B7C33E6